MNQETITQNNKLIAEFMKLPCWAPYWNGGVTYQNSYFKTKEECEVLINNSNYLSGRDAEPKVMPLHYHESWDWIMPVVEKIECFPGTHTWSVEITDDSCIIYEYTNESDDPSPVFSTLFGKNKLESTYLTVVKLIEWLNQQQNNPAIGIEADTK